MAIETGAAAGGIAAYHPETRKETWWRALGAGVGGPYIAIDSKGEDQLFGRWAGS